MIQAWRPPQPDIALAYTLVSVPAGAYITVPDGRCGLVWADDHLWWLGPATRPWRTPRRMRAVVGVRLAHLTGRPFAGRPLREWTDDRARLADLVGRTEATTLGQRLAGAVSDVARVSLLLNYVASRVSFAAPQTGAAPLLEAMSQGQPVSAFAQQAGLSVRQIHRRSLEAFGMAPTTLRRVLRLHRAAAMHSSGTGSSLAQTATAAGYSDQAHLARECRRLTLTQASVALAGGVGSVRFVQDGT